MLSTITSNVMEIEVKVPVVDREVVLSKVRSLGASELGRTIQEDLYFRHPSRDFGRTDEALRLRRDGLKELITYKGPKLDGRSKTREEIEFPVSFDEMGLLLSRLGFVGTFKVRKVRTEFELEGVHICLDDVEGLGSFIELEFKGQDVDEGLRRIDGLKGRLGIEGNETRSYLELLYFKE